MMIMITLFEILVLSRGSDQEEVGVETDEDHKVSAPDVWGNPRGSNECWR